MRRDVHLLNSYIWLMLGLMGVAGCSKGHLSNGSKSDETDSGTDTLPDSESGSDLGSDSGSETDSETDTPTAGGADAGREGDTGDGTDSVEESDSDLRSDTGSETDTFACILPAAVESCDSGWCRVPSGCFLYGSPNQVYVTLTHPFVISSTEVTQAEWEAMGFPNPSLSTVCPDCPVSTVDWYEAIAYCNALSDSQGLERCYDLSCCEGTIGSACEREGEHFFCQNVFTCTCDVVRYEDVYECPGYRLPTAAEWEYAARAGTTTNTYNGNSGSADGDHCAPDPVVDEISWSCSNTDRAMPVAQKKKNVWGLFDMLGNLYEWCGDPQTDTLSERRGENFIDPQGSAEEVAERVAKGGSWDRYPSYCRPTTEMGSFVDFKYGNVGIRPTRTLFE